ncbi:MAG: class II fructose-bisphosphate aldolase, partial [Microbacterium sp.]|nr:class II fructose-bisphosphate aldolase [Microbacterium sp.]
MALITLTATLDAARAGGYGVGAFNVTDLAQAEAVLDAAAETDSPVIVQTIAGASTHGRDELFWEALVNLIAHYPDVPVVLHLDHGASYDDCVRAIGAGFTSVMIDGSM